LLKKIKEKAKAIDALKAVFFLSDFRFPIADISYF
jgi:hypothetical protein